MIGALLLFALAMCVYFPSLWVRWVMHEHKVEQTAPHTDHYDPSAKTVRLSPDNFAGKSLTAVAVAAHEVGHALQHHRDEEIFKLRSRYVPTAKKLERLGIMILWAVPVVGLLVKAPAAIFGLIAISIAFQLAGALSYLVVLKAAALTYFAAALANVLNIGRWLMVLVKSNPNASTPRLSTSRSKRTARPCSTVSACHSNRAFRT